MLFKEFLGIVVEQFKEISSLIQIIFSMRNDTATFHDEKDDASSVDISSSTISALGGSKLRSSVELGSSG